MNSARQAPHFSEGMLISTSLLLPFFFFALTALQVGLPGLLATREGGPTSVHGASCEFLRGDACMVALPPPRHYLPAANREEDLMPERGPVQLLLHFLRVRPTPGWKIGLAVALVSTLALLPGEESLYHKAKAGLAQVAASSCLEARTCRRARAEAMALGPFHSRRQFRGAAAWPERRRSMRPRRQGLRADRRAFTQAGRNRCTRPASGVRRDAGSPRMPMPSSSRAPSCSLSKTAMTSSGSRARRYRPRLQQGDCSPLKSSIPGALHLIIEAIQGNRTSPTEIERKL